jgi:hypothetical protein
MDIFKDMKKAKQTARRPQTTIIKVQSYEIDPKDSRKSAIVGLDMLNADESGVPKQVRVNTLDPSGKSMGINDFANPSAMMNTQVGGLIRLDQFIVRGDGNYVARHMQRVTKTEGPRVGRDQKSSEIGYMKAWTKVIAERDKNGDVAEFELNNKTISRGRAHVIPEDTQPSPVTFGTKDFKETLSKIIEQAVQKAPERTKPMLLMRAEGNENQTEVVLQTLRQNADKSYSLMPKQEILEATRDNYGLKEFLAANDRAQKAGVTQDVEFLSGYQLDLVGLTKDPRSGEALANPRVQSMVRETARFFAIPKKTEQEDQQYSPAKRPEYKLSVISYQIPQSDDAKTASLETLGSVPGVVASPDAGLTVTSNPYYPADGAPAQQPAPANQNQAAEPPTPAPVDEEPPMQDDIDSTMDPDDLLREDMIDDFDVDDLEEQLAAQGN